MAQKRTIIGARALETRSVQAIVALLKQLRADVLAELLGQNVSEYRALQLQTILRELDKLVTVSRIKAGDVAAKAITDAFKAGSTMSQLAARAIVKVTPSLYGFSANTLPALLDVTKHQTTAIWTELGSKLATQVRRSVLGTTNPYEAMVRLAQGIKNPKTFGTAMNRAEAVIRSETGRTFNISAYRTASETAKRIAVAGAKLGKWWLNVHDHRTREEHEQAGKDYPKGKAIPWDQPFIVGGEALRFPLDPDGSPGNTINCRCQAIYTVL